MKKLLTMLLAMSIVPATFGGVVYIQESEDALEGDGNGRIHFVAELEQVSRLYLSNSSLAGSASLAAARSEDTSELDAIEDASGDATIELGKYSQAKSTASGITACAEMESSDAQLGFAALNTVVITDDANFGGTSASAQCNTAADGTGVGQKMSFIVPVGYVMENSGASAQILLENVSVDEVDGGALGVAATFSNVKVKNRASSEAAQDLMMTDGQIILTQDTADQSFAHGDAGVLDFSMELDLTPGAVKAALVSTDIEITVAAE